MTRLMRLAVPTVALAACAAPAGVPPGAAAPAPAATARPATATSTRSATARPTATGSPSAAHPGRVVLLALPALSLGVSHAPTYVYLPPGYATGTRRYPVLYLLHGAPGDSRDWFREGGVAATMDRLIAGGMPPAIVVAPSTNDGLHADRECLDTRDGPKLATYLARYVVGAVDARFRTLADRGSRAIAGFSAGADCALDLALRHLSTFSAVGGFTTTGEPGPQTLWLVLHGDRAAYRADAPVDYLPSMRFSHPLAVVLDTGDRNRHVVARTWLLAAELRTRGQQVVVRIEHGYGHTWDAARVGFSRVAPLLVRMLRS